MGMFEDVILNIKETVDVIGKKTGKVVDVSKLKLNAAEIEGDIKRSFEELGEIVYKNKVVENLSQEDLSENITKIDNLYNKLNGIKSKIAATKNKVKCPNCDFENESNALFCSMCGHKILVDSNDSIEEKEENNAVEEKNK